MRVYRAPLFGLSLLLLLPFPLLARGGTGAIEGQISHIDGRFLQGVGVRIDGTSWFAITDEKGGFEFRGIPAGTYELSFRLLDNAIARSDVAVEARATTTVQQIVEWNVAFAETVTVRAVSRRRERIVEAPAAVTTISQLQMEREAAHGLTPKLFEFTPGVDITQINLAEFLINTRGFNSGLNRRVPVLVDGRDLTDPFVGAMEWPTVSYPLNDFAEMDLVRGPTSALYGANATSGVINITTKSPRSSQGGLLRLAAGELSSVNTELRWAGAIGRDWYAKIVGGRRKSEGYSVSRTESPEYAVFCDPPAVVVDCLLRETIPLLRDEIGILFGGLRFDKYLQDGALITLEGGTTSYDGNVFISIPGRGQIRRVERPWARFNYSNDYWTVAAYYSERETKVTNLVTTNPFLMDADNFRLEFQTHRSLAEDRIRIVAGGSYFKENVGSSALATDVNTDEQSLFAQADWQVHDRLKLVGALRWDESSLHDAEINPKASIVFSATPRHTLRLTYNEAFQQPTYAEYFVDLPVGTVDLAGLNLICLDNAGVDCGLGASSPSLLLGNDDLELEEVRSFELGYKGVLGKRGYLTLDLYDSENRDFATTFMPQRHPVLGTINNNFGEWVGPPEAESTPIDPAACPASDFGTTVADCVRAEALALLGTSQLTNRDGEAIVVALSLTSFGQVDTRGADLGLGYFLSDAWRLSFSYSWFDYDLMEDGSGLANVLLPNAPENKATIGLSFAKGDWDASLRGRWVEDFRWINASGLGHVEEFTTFDLNGNYALDENWRLGVNVANLFDDEHWEAFGGDLLGRRAMAHVTYTW